MNNSRDLFTVPVADEFLRCAMPEFEIDAGRIWRAQMNFGTSSGNDLGRATQKRLGVELGETQARIVRVVMITDACRTHGSPAPEFRWDSGLWVEFPFSSQDGEGTPVETREKTRERAKSGSVTDPVTDPVDRLLLVLGEDERSPSEILHRLGLKHRPTFRENYLRPALAQGLVEMTRPDKPSSRLQQYRLTEHGLTTLIRLKGKSKR